MARAKNKLNFLKALTELELDKGIDKDYIIECLKGAVAKSYIKSFLKGGDDALVEVEIDQDSGNIVIVEEKTVVKEVEDDYLEIGIDDEKIQGLGLNEGELYKTYIPFEDLVTENSYGRFLKGVMNNFKARITDAEKAALLELYEDKIGELITVKVENFNKDTRELTVNLGRTSIVMDKRDLIGDETFSLGEDIKVYVCDVQTNQKGAQIHLSRSDAGYLRRVFENEVHEIYEGTVTIKNIAREAGKRTKISVCSNDPDVDPCGACIGSGGNRIQNITKYLGNARKKEKIDVVLFNKNPSLYVAEALVPASVRGIMMNQEDNSCVAIVKNGDLSLAIGKSGVNVRLAVKLTGLKIDIKEQDAAYKEGIDFTSIEDLRERESEIKESVIEENSKDQEINDVFDEFDKEEENVETTDETSTISAHIEEKEETIDTNPIVSEDNIKTEEETRTEVKVTTSYDDLIKSLEEEKKDSSKPQFKKVYKKPSEEKKSTEVLKETSEQAPAMAFYTDEELAELDNEENDTYSFEDDYSEYDDDDFYEEDK